MFKEETHARKVVEWGRTWYAPDAHTHDSLISLKIVGNRCLDLRKDKSDGSALQW